MHLAKIEQSLHEAIDAGDTDTLEHYVEHVAESMNPLTEALCLAIIGMDFRAWERVMALTDQWDPALADALKAIEAHIDRQRASFIESRARNISDAAEHNAQCLAELQEELNGECRA